MTKNLAILRQFDWEKILATSNKLNMIGELNRKFFGDEMKKIHQVEKFTTLGDRELSEGWCLSLHLKTVSVQLC